MGNKNSATSKPHSGKRAKLASIQPQPHNVVSRPRKLSTKSEVVSVRAYPTEKQGEKPLCDDHTFSNNVVSRPRKLSTKSEVVSVRAYPTEKQGEKPLCDDHTFSNYIQRTKYKIRSNSNICCHEDQRDPPCADHAAHGTNNNNENERDPYSDYIQHARKKLRMRTLSRNTSSFKRG